MENENNLAGKEIFEELFLLNKQRGALDEMFYDLQNLFGEDHELAEVVDKWISMIRTEIAEKEATLYSKQSTTEVKNEQDTLRNNIRGEINGLKLEQLNLEIVTKSGGSITGEAPRDMAFRLAQQSWALIEAVRGVDFLSEEGTELRDINNYFNKKYLELLRPHNENK
ncbi:hypothetical protein 015DV002_67 [Bacillus phage 015DV002]|nr:hypothetical protein 015DV002_67 [Bacillus phage 015DV002]